MTKKSEATLSSAERGAVGGAGSGSDSSPAPSPAERGRREERERQREEKFAPYGPRGNTVSTTIAANSDAGKTESSQSKTGAASITPVLAPPKGSLVVGSSSVSTAILREMVNDRDKEAKQGSPTLPGPRSGSRGGGAGVQSRPRTGGGGKRPGYGNGGLSDGDGEGEDGPGDVVTQIDMDDFSRLMDTLARQPSINSSNRVDAENSKFQPDFNVSFKASEFSAQLRNFENGVGAAFHSEKGRRDDNEDRCFLLPDVSVMRALEGRVYVGDAKEQLQKFSLACVFDGHGGWRTAQFLSMNLPPTLVTHQKFLDKTPDAAIFDVCRTMDSQVCTLLRREDNTSGSTGTICVYDGRKHLLSVANVGDSMCVLSRNGKAVKMSRMHRLGPDDDPEGLERLRGARRGGRRMTKKE